MPTGKHPCSNCGQLTYTLSPFDTNEPEYLCRNCCYSLSITSTEAKSSYKLKDHHLANLTPWVYKTSYRVTTRRYLLSEIKVIAAEEHGTDDPNEITLRTQRTSRPVDYTPEFEDFWGVARRDRGKKTAFTRFKRMARQLPTWQEDPCRTTKNLIISFILTGNDSNLSKFHILQTLQNNPDLPHDFDYITGLPYVKDAFEAFTEKATMPNVNTTELYQTEVIPVLNRYTELNQALAAKGIEMRDDSSLCRQYMFRDRHAKTLNTTVEIMENMKFLYEKTDYANINRNMIDFERSMSRRYYYDEWSQEDYHQISKQAQVAAVKDYIRKGGDPDLVPEGLKKNL